MCERGRCDPEFRMECKKNFGSVCSGALKCVLASACSCGGIKFVVLDRDQCCIRIVIFGSSPLMQCLRRSLDELVVKALNA